MWRLDVGPTDPQVSQEVDLDVELPADEVEEPVAFTETAPGSPDGQQVRGSGSEVESGAGPRPDAVWLAGRGDRLPPAVL